MRPNIIYLLTTVLILTISGNAFSQEDDKKSITRADTVRGSILPEREWWNVLRYDLTVKPDPESKTISGKNEIQFEVTQSMHAPVMQIDLQDPLLIDSIVLNSSLQVDFKKQGNAWYADVNGLDLSAINTMSVHYHGKPLEAKFPPWDGGWVWKKDSLGFPWISAACQGIGASVWYPCKDHQSDEPDDGASLTIITPQDLVGVGNGRLASVVKNDDGTTSYKWEVTNPINNYNLIPYIGKYEEIKDVYAGEKGVLDISLWVLDYNVEKAKQHVLPGVIRTLKAFEHWFGPYAFYEDSYKLVDAPYAGMEHQSAIAYGNKYLNGFWGNDISKTGWGKKFDYMVVHESGHEWFGNNITTADIADMWVHEGFTCYSEVLFTEFWYGKEAGDEYSYGLRNNIQNKNIVVQNYGINQEPGQDMYYKGQVLLHTIRHSMNDDEKFRSILRGLNKDYYHGIVTTGQVENYFNERSGFNYGKVFDQFLRNKTIPILEYYFTNSNKTVHYRYVNCIKGFDLPLFLKGGNDSLKIYPGTEWKSSTLNSASASRLFNSDKIEKMYYIAADRVSKPE